ncbi:Chromo domain [Dillenia turbinata]|uniref:Chromo domain n=1 Tax=Dillenia turbinata TaxID=194707 RepID=A0AAN8UY71_9MAGN
MKGGGKKRSEEADNTNSSNNDEPTDLILITETTTNTFNGDEDGNIKTSSSNPNNNGSSQTAATNTESEAGAVIEEKKTGDDVAAVKEKGKEKVEEDGQVEEEEDDNDEEKGFDEENDDYDDEDDADADDNDVEMDHQNGAGERPKLADGFFEVEAIRRRRVRKGELQYLIKWRGWPEAANTWEPLENLLTCMDVVDAFEDRLKSKNKPSRKRKRKNVVSQTQPKKKMLQRSVTTTRSGRGVNNCISGRGVNNNKILHETSSAVPIYNLGEERKEPGDLDAKLIELKEASKEASVANLGEGVAVACGPLKFDSTEPVQEGRFTGAKRRKSGSVKRFRQDSSACESADDQNMKVRTAIGTCDFLGIDLGCRNKFEEAKSKFSITKIIKPISYSSSVVNDVQDVSVTFLAARTILTSNASEPAECRSFATLLQETDRILVSVICDRLSTKSEFEEEFAKVARIMNNAVENGSDGEEVMVDNKFLKANNPLLVCTYFLISALSFLPYLSLDSAFLHLSSYQQASISSIDSGGSGFGAILLVLLFLILCHMV